MIIEVKDDSGVLFADYGTGNVVIRDDHESLNQAVVMLLKAAQFISGWMYRRLTRPLLGHSDATSKPATAKFIRSTKAETVTSDPTPEVSAPTMTAPHSDS